MHSNHHTWPLLRTICTLIVVAFVAAGCGGGGGSSGSLPPPPPASQTYSATLETVTAVNRSNGADVPVTGNAVAGATATLQ